MYGREKQVGEWIMVFGPTSRAVGRFLKKQKMTKSGLTDFNIPITLMGRASDTGIVCE